MNFQLINISTIDLNPCIIDYSLKFNCFIVGTYELCENASKFNNDYSEDDLRYVNNRIGSLNVFNDCNILVHEHRCKSGGVFDLKISNYKMAKNDDLILVAHSNGVCAFYSFNGSRIDLLKQIETNCQMLTTVDDQILNQDFTISVGSSIGKVICYNFNSEDKEFLEPNFVIEHTVTKNSLSVWYVKIIHLKETQTKMIIVCSEDSQWRIFQIRDQNLNEIYKNNDSAYGVTSVECFRIRFHNGKATMILLVGSYDEYLRIYNLELSDLNNLNNIHCDILDKIHIEGGGIWRIRCIEENILLSAMYSGAYHLKLFTINKSDCPESGGKINIEMKKLPMPLGDSGEHLIYGIASDRTLSRILFSSFYAKKNFLSTIQ